VQSTTKRGATAIAPKPLSIQKQPSTPLASGDQSPSAANGSTVAYLPLVDGSEFGISAETLAEFDKAYPAVDCKQTLQEMRAWCIANPKNQKTRTGVLRFVNTWLSKEQNKAR
jgi:hypothetical protein